MEDLSRAAAPVDRRRDLGSGAGPGAGPRRWPAGGVRCACRLHQRPRSPARSATTVTTRLAIDRLRSARARREKYVGSWLPEPLVTAVDDGDPEIRAERAEDISLAFLLLLERLSPVERAAFLLREVFGYDYADISRVVGKSGTNSRQLVHRARAHLEEPGHRFEASPAKRQELADRFFAACTDGDLPALERTLAQDVVFHADGGGKAAAIPRPLHGRKQVARFLVGLVRHASARGWCVERAVVNAEPGARLVDDGGTSWLSWRCMWPMGRCGPFSTS